MSKFKKKIVKQIIAYALAGAMIMSNMASPNGTVFASEADTGERYQVEESSKEIEETSDEEEQIVEKDEKEDDVNEPTSTSTGSESGSNTSVESTPAGNEPTSSEPALSEPAASAPEGSSVQPSSSDEGTSSEPNSSDEGSSTPPSQSEPESKPITYPVTYDFRDGSIIPTNTTNGTDTVKSADGALTVECGPSNGYAYNGAQHGSIFKTGNKITIHVPGSVKVFIGGCQFSGTRGTTDGSQAAAKLTVTDKDAKTVYEVEDTYVAGCYNNDDKGLSFEYKGEEDRKSVV